MRQMNTAVGTCRWQHGMVLALVMVLALAGVASARVWTDQDDYSPGSIVTISGDNSDEAGYLAEETILVEVSGPDGYFSSCRGVADSEGAWTCQVTLWADESAVGEYSYTATGETSGVTESGRFADGVPLAHTCAITRSGTAVCWGDNSFGQLGDGTTNDRLVPVEVSGLPDSVIRISIGKEHSCALTDDGQVWCWGRNRVGQLGDGSRTDRSIPTAVVGHSKATQISAGEDHTCVVTEDREVECWGSNNSGQLGNGSNIASNYPVQVSGLDSGVVQVSAGSSHTCALTETGGVKCWGKNFDGQLGTGTTISSWIPLDVQDLTSGVSQITAGGAHTCALLEYGGVQCWGSNEYGQLGDGSQISRTAPVKVIDLDSGTTQVAASVSHTCALAGEGGVKCWGYNVFDQLGSPVGEANSPVDVVGLRPDVSQITVGRYHSCALSLTGVRCWGNNSRGQLGNGTTTSGYRPVSVNALLGKLAASQLSDQTGYQVGYSDWLGQLVAVELSIECVVQETYPYEQCSAYANYSFRLNNGYELSTGVMDTEIDIPPEYVTPYSLSTIAYNPRTREIVVQQHTVLGDEGEEVRLSDPQFGTFGEPTETLNEALMGTYRKGVLEYRTTPISWRNIDDVKSSIHRQMQYSSNRQELGVLPGSPYITPAFPFNGESDFDANFGQSPHITRQFPLRSFAEIVYEDQPNYYARAYLFPGQGDLDYLNRPMIIVDAFDPWSSRRPRDLYYGADFSKFFDLDYPNSPRNQGYDVYFLDFSQGAGDILVNASLTLKFLEWMQEQTDAKIIIGGPSMGGIITRLALLYALENNNTSNRYLAENVVGYLSIDSPQQGASLDPSFPEAMYRFLRTLKQVIIVGGSDEVTNGIEAWKASLMPATYQMLYVHPYVSGELFGEDSEISANDEAHGLFFGFLEQLGGYNSLIPKAAIAYSNFYVPHPGYNRTVRLLVGDVRVYLPFISPLPFWQFFSAGGDPTSESAVERAGYQEMMPGSTSNRFYYDLLTSKPANDKLHLYDIKNEMFKGTFMPIHTALDLDTKRFDILDPPTTDEGEMASYSAFDAVYYMEDEFNCYHRQSNGQCRENVDDRRYQHVIFDDQLMADIVAALRFLEGACAVPFSGNWEVEDDCVLLTDRKAPESVLVREGATLTISEGASLDIDFKSHNLTIEPGGKVLVQRGGKLK